jgi:hypothetical protein
MIRTSIHVDAAPFDDAAGAASTKRTSAGSVATCFSGGR